MKWIGRWLPAALALSLALPAAARGADCAYDPVQKKVSYAFDWQTYNVPFTVSAVGPSPDAALSISTTAAPHQCLGPTGGPHATVSNTDTIEITQVPPFLGEANVMAVDLTHPLGPGYTDEGDGSSEIEIVLTAPVRFTYVQGGPGADRVRVGENGVNLNAAETVGDVDILGASSVWMWGNGGNDDLSNAGGAGTGRERFPEQYGGMTDGGPGDDVLVQTAERAQVRGGPGDDVITGDEWHIDSSTTTALYDDATGGVTVDLGRTDTQPIGGGLGNDVLTNLQIVVGGSFDDELRGSDAHRNELFGGDGNDRFQGGASFDTLHGENGDDTLNGGGGVDTLFGEAGGDSLDGQGGNDHLIADPEGKAGSDTLAGGPGNDDLHAGGGADALDGGDGDDVLDSGGAETDSAIGGAGTDLLRYGVEAWGGPATGVVVDLAALGAQDTKGGGVDTIAGVENVEATRFSDELYGTDGANRLHGGDPLLGEHYAGADYIDGAGGDDRLTSWEGNRNPVVIWGGLGSDQLVGGSANDELYGEEGDDALVANGGSDYLSAGPGKDTLSAGWGDDWLLGEAGDDSLDGGDDNDLLQADDIGQVGADSLQGGYGDDELEGGAGADALSGGPGDDGLDPGGSEPDTMIGGDGDDYLHYALQSSGEPLTGVDIDLAVSVQQDTRGGGLDTFTTIEHAEGTRFADRLLGTSGSNILLGGTADASSPSSGADYLDGRAGDDVLATEEGNPDPVTLAGGGGSDLIGGGSGGDALYGGDGDDALLSHAGADSLNAGSGRDDLAAGSGEDSLIANDGELDNLDCGADVDHVDFDKGLDILSSECEIPNDVGSGPGTAVQTPSPPSAVNGAVPLAAFRVAKVVKLPPNRKGKRRCVTGRAIKIEIRQPGGVLISLVRAFVNGKEVARALNGKWSDGLKVRLARRRSTVTVLVDAADGRSATVSRTYRRCARRIRRND